MGKVNKCSKGIGLGNVFRNFLWEKKKTTYFFDSFFIFSMKVASEVS